MPSIDPNALPYRPCVGVVVFNGEGLIWIGRRCDELTPQESVRRWQMPQGGIDDSEDPKQAALRELYEETGIRSVEVVAESKGWITYDLPPEAVGIALKGKYRGQRQKWFAMRFTGDESEITLAAPGHRPEFDAWRWAHPREVLDAIVGFKRAAYEAVLTEFAPFLAA
jgi:putative (di)nucleoside polyphosphate hydrolase